MEQYEQCKNSNFQLVMHLGLVSTQVTALFKLLCTRTVLTLAHCRLSSAGHA